MLAHACTDASMHVCAGGVCTDIGIFFSPGAFESVVDTCTDSAVCIYVCMRLNVAS